MPVIGGSTEKWEATSDVTLGHVKGDGIIMFLTKVSGVWERTSSRRLAGIVPISRLH